MIAAKREYGWPKALAGFLVIFAIYQLAEALQTEFAPGNAAGPALMLLALGSAWPVARWLGSRGYRAYGLETSQGWLAILAGGLLLAFLAKLASLAAAPLVGAGDVAVGSGTTLAMIAIMAVSTFMPSLTEDIITRGFLLRIFPIQLGGLAYVLASAALYTANHIWRFDWGLTEQIRLFCLGLAYGAAAWRWRSLWGAVALHRGWNLANALSGGILSVEGGDVEAARLLTASAHLVLLAVILLVPGRRVSAANSESSGGV